MINFESWYARLISTLAIGTMALLVAACGNGESDVATNSTEKLDTDNLVTTVVETALTETAPSPLSIDADSFRCLEAMTKVRHFFVDNLLGDVDATIEAAESTTGAVYPAGSVVQLVPGEVMVKHPAGFNAATRDWEFFELDVTAEGSSIRNRGFVDVVNRFDGNCFGCHIKARPEFDLICERDHGCDDIPFTREQIAQVQAADPRCSG